MPRPPTALPVLPVPSGPDALLKPREVAKQLGSMSTSRFDTYWKRYPLLVSGVRIVQSVESGRGVLHFLQTYVTAHAHTEMARTRDAAPVRPPDQVHIDRILVELRRPTGRRVA